MTRLAERPRPARVALFVTCLGDVFIPRWAKPLCVCCIVWALPLTSLLARRVADNRRSMRVFASPRDVARRNLTLFANAEYIIVPSGSCAAMWRVFYPELFADDPVLGEQAEALAARTYELAEFLVHVVGVERLGAVFHGKVTYHASCHLLRELGVAEEPRRLISQVEGTELVPMDLAEQCCGFGGTFAVKYPEISDAMLQKKIASLKRAGADTLVSCDAGCLMHIAGRLRRQGETIRIMHLAELLNAGSATDAQASEP